MNSLQDLVTRAEEKYNPDTWWTEWRGGDDCPVADGVEVQLRYRQGGVLLTEHAPHCDWQHYGAHSDIVGYHVIEPPVKENPANPLAVQVAGDHYKKLKIQPIEFIHANGIPFAEGSVIKYVTRWRDKGGIKDLEKARHFLDLLIDLERKAKE